MDLKALEDVADMIETCELGWVASSNLSTFTLECYKCENMNLVFTGCNGSHILARVSQFQEMFGKYPDFPDLIRPFLVTREASGGVPNELPDYKETWRHMEEFECNNEAIKAIIIASFFEHLAEVKLFLRVPFVVMRTKSTLLSYSEDFLLLEFV
jgi:hypothetical protein